MRDNRTDSSDPSYVSFHGDITVRYYEELPDLKVRRRNFLQTISERSIIRPVEVELEFIVRFPAEVMIESENQTTLAFGFSSIEAIVDKRMILLIPRVNSFGILTFATVTKRPWKLSASNISVVHSVADLEVTITSGTNITRLVFYCEGDSFTSGLCLLILAFQRYVEKCQLGQDRDCLQYWTVTIAVLSNSQCDLNDLYNFTFKTEALSSLHPEAPDNVTHSLQLRTTNFCPQIVEDIDFVSSFKTYSDPSRLMFF